jgi:hypothetical protein
MGKPKIWLHRQRLGAPDPSVGAAVGRQVLQKHADEFAANHRCNPRSRADDAGSDRWWIDAAKVADGTRRWGLDNDGGVEHPEKNSE